MPVVFVEIMVYGVSDRVVRLHCAGKCRDDNKQVCIVYTTIAAVCCSSVRSASRCRIPRVRTRYGMTCMTCMIDMLVDIFSTAKCDVRLLCSLQ